MLRNDVKRMRRELRCGAKLGAAEKLMLLVLRGRSESRSCPPSRGSSVGSGDRLPTAKQMAAMAGAISGAKVSSGQCLRGWRRKLGVRTIMAEGAERAHLAMMLGGRGLLDGFAHTDR